MRGSRVSHPPSGGTRDSATCIQYIKIYKLNNIKGKAREEEYRSFLDIRYV